MRKSILAVIPALITSSVLVFFFIAGGCEKNSVGADGLVYETRTRFSRIKVEDTGRTRYLLFVRDSGQEVVESAMNLDHPDVLVLEYTHIMFASFLFKQQPEDCLLVGMGAGSMIRFLNRNFENTRLDVVEIDPGIIDVARTYFGLVPNNSTRIFNEDGFDYLMNRDNRYDVIYLDAFLKPSTMTDSTGFPRRFKNRDFYEMLKGRLKADGIVVFNINNNPDTKADIAEITSSFAQVYVFPDRAQGNIIVIASKNSRRMTRQEILAAARQMDSRGIQDFSFQDIASLYRGN